MGIAAERAPTLSAVTMRSRLALAALALLSLPLSAACTSDEGSTTPSSSVPLKGVAPCSELYADGKKITTADFGIACVIDDGTESDGELVTPLPVRITCEDDRKLYWNDLAWGFLNDVMTLTPSDVADKTPSAALEQCLAEEPAAG